MRYFLLDRITRIELGKEIEGVKCWTLSDEIFNDHFPGFPVVPGALLTESKAQLLGFLVEQSHEMEFHFKNGIFVLLSIIQKAKFRNFVIPGDQCILKAQLRTLDINRASGHVKTYVENVCVAEADLSFIILPKDVAPGNKFLERREEYIEIITRSHPGKQ